MSVGPAAAPAAVRPPRVAARLGVALLIALGAAAVLTAMGRIPWCACGSPVPWSGDIWTSHNSQHLLDPYSFTHFLHGILFYGLLWALLRNRADVGTRGLMALALEAGWEILENSPLVIERYRQATISLNYTGDSVLNSMGDLLSCGVGFAVAAVVPAWASVALVFLVEGALLLTIRDSLLLNVWMLLAPNEAIRRWQGGGL